MLKRGVHSLKEPMLLKTSVTVRRERNFSGGGGVPPHPSSGGCYSPHVSSYFSSGVVFDISINLAGRD